MIRLWYMQCLTQTAFNFGFIHFFVTAVEAGAESDK